MKTTTCGLHGSGTSAPFTLTGACLGWTLCHAFLIGFLGYGRGGSVACVTWPYSWELFFHGLGGAPTVLVHTGLGGGWAGGQLTGATARKAMPPASSNRPMICLLRGLVPSEALGYFVDAQHFSMQTTSLDTTPKMSISLSGLAPFHGMCVWRHIKPEKLLRKMPTTGGRICVC